MADDRGEMRYGAFWARSGDIDRALIAQGFKAGDTAAVHAPYGREILVGMLGILRAGGIYIPFDAAYPKQRLEAILDDAGAKAILTTRAYWEMKRLDAPGVSVIFMDEVAAGDEAPPPCEGLSADSPAMLLYTSGTTGRPKGVLHTQRMLTHIANCLKIPEGAALNADTRSGIVSGIAFVATQLFMIGPLAVGGCVCFAPELARHDLSAMNRFIRTQHITHIFIPSGLAAIYIEDYDTHGLTILAAGEKLRRFTPHSKGDCLINGYGSTETSGMLCKRIYGSEPEYTVGTHAPGTRVMIVDENLKPAAPSEAGELLFTSDYMSTQYYHLPEQTRQKWVEIDQTLWFRTGDRARYTADGDVDILGRIDNMIKLRGFRIESGEVEARIARAVSERGERDVGQIVVALRTVGGTDHLVCYYESPRELDTVAVSSEIAEVLADYMVPDIWVRMDAMPRNVNGKVVRDQLPQPKPRLNIAGALDSEVVARVVWTAADVLGVADMISPEDGFADLGGTSLTAMKYAQALRQQGIKIAIGDILRLNTLRMIAEAAEVDYSRLWTREEYEGVLADFASRNERVLKVLPITAKQDEMLFEQIIHPDRAHFRKLYMLQIDSLLSEADLRWALDSVSEEYEVLRSAIVYHRVSAIQQVITDRTIPLYMLDMNIFDLQEMNALRRTLLDAPMDLQRDSIVKVVCIHANGQSYLCFVTCQIAFDAAQFRNILFHFMDAIQKRYPQDASLPDWRALFELSIQRQRQSAGQVRAEPVSQNVKAPPEIFVYSENAGPRLVFVHTGSTGSEAYYQLARRIAPEVSFAVIEPYNLYHMDQAVYGIKNIAAKYIEILRRYQPKGPYDLGGWCYGGVVAHEMACQLEQAGEEVRHLFLLDAHAYGNPELRYITQYIDMTNREYLETSPLFAQLRENGMLEAMVMNAAHVAEDMANHIPSVYHGNVTYFKPMQLPAGVEGNNLLYWKKMMEFDAGNYEKYVDAQKLRIIFTPHEHDLMMDEPSLDIIAPKITEALRGSE